MRLLAASLFLVASACARAPLEPVGTSLPRPLPPPSELEGTDAGPAIPEKVHHECELLINAFAHARQLDPDRPARKVLDAVFDDPPPMPIATLDWCRKELLRIVER